MKIRKILGRLKRIFGGGTYSVKELRDRGMTIGENCHIYTNQIDFPHAYLISVGNNVTISNARILTHDGSTKKILGYSRVGRVDIGNDVFIGAGAIILPNVKIGSRVIVGAGAVVSRDIPDNSVVVGNPARVVGTYDAFVEKNTALMEKVPIQKTHYSVKTAEEKQQMKEALAESGWGFDE